MVSMHLCHMLKVEGRMYITKSSKNSTTYNFDDQTLKLLSIQHCMGKQSLYMGLSKKLTQISGGPY